MFKFYLAPYISPTKANYQQVTCLATGLSNLKVDFCGNIDYWVFEKPLISKNEIDGEVGIYTFQYLAAGGQLQNNKKRILLDFSDPGYPSLYPHFDLVLRTHCVERDKNVKPWIFTLPPQILTAINSLRDGKTEDGVFINFRVNHSSREEEVKRVVAQCKNVLVKQTQGVPGDPLWEQTGRRFCLEYITLLNKYRYTLAVGGYFTKNILKQWDSWRFWEAMYSDGIPLHYDLSKLSAVFPEEVKPLANTHYIAIDNGYNFSKFSEKNLQEISLNGVEFVSEQCSPNNLANIFLSWI